MVYVVLFEFDNNIYDGPENFKGDYLGEPVMIKKYLVIIKVARTFKQLHHDTLNS